MGLSERERLEINKIESLLTGMIAETQYTLEELRSVFARIKTILEKADVNELRELIHLMLESVTLGADRKPENMKIKINPTLTSYLCINNQEEAKEASSFSFASRKELTFEVGF